MTVNTTNITSGPYIGTGASDTFSYTFRVQDKTQLKVFETTDAGVQTELVVDTDYTVSGIGDAAGGLITRVAGNLPTDYVWYIRSNYEETQLTAFGSQGGFFPDVHEDAMDKLTFLIQQLLDGNDRTFRLSESIGIDGDFSLTSDAATRASKFLTFDGGGNLIVSTGTGADAGLRADLASTALALGASLVAVRDAGGNFTAANVEGVLAEIIGEVDANTADIATNAAAIAQNLIALTLTHDMASDADYTLSAAENLNGRVVVTDTGVLLTTGRNIVVADTARVFIVQNDTAQTLTFKTSAGTGIAIAAGDNAILFSDGTNVEYQVVSASETKKGLVERATQAEVDGGTDTERFVTPATMASYSNAGKWALIDSWVPTAVASKDFTWDESLYSDIRIVIEGVIPATDDNHLYLRLGYNNGGNFYTGTGDYSYVIEAQNPAAGTYVQPATYLNTYLPISCGVDAGVAYTDTQNGVGSAAGEGYSGTIELLGMASPVSNPRAHCDFSYVDDIGQYQWGVMDGVVADATADTTQLDSARIYWESGNFEVAGKIWVYGLLRT